MYQSGYSTVVGKLYIAEECGHIVRISFDEINAEKFETPLIKKTYKELSEYFNGKRKNFDIPIKLAGTAFQLKVWNELKQIPYGKTASYKDIAIKIGREKAYRAVGMANNKNPVAIIIPCHRVIGSNKSLTGYAGGLDIKEKLLKIEGVL